MSPFFDLMLLEQTLNSHSTWKQCRCAAGLGVHSATKPGNGTRVSQLSWHGMFHTISALLYSHSPGLGALSQVFTGDIKKSFLRYEYMTITSCFPSLTPKSICKNLLVPLPFAILQKFPPVALWNPFCCSRWFHLGGSDGIVVSHVELPNCVEPDFAWVRNGLEGPCNKKRCKGMQNMVPCQSCPSVVWIHDIPAMGGHARGGTLKICLGHVKRCVCCSFLSGFKKNNVSNVFPPCEVLPVLLVVCSPGTAFLELVLRLLVLRCAGFAVVTFFLRLHSKILHKGWFCVFVLVKVRLQLQSYW